MNPSLKSYIPFDREDLDKYFEGSFYFSYSKLEARSQEKTGIS
jgi:hypothetical protein